MAVLDDVAERFLAHVAMVVMQKQQRIAVDHADLVDRLGLGRHGVPHA